MAFNLYGCGDLCFDPRYAPLQAFFIQTGESLKLELVHCVDNEPGYLFVCENIAGVRQRFLHNAWNDLRYWTARSCSKASAFPEFPDHLLAYSRRLPSDFADDRARGRSHGL